MLLEIYFTSALVDGLSLEFEWQQVSSSLPESSQYSGRYQQCYSLDSLHSSSYFQVLKSSSDCTKSTNYNWYNRRFHVPLFFQFPSKVLVLILLYHLFIYLSIYSFVCVSFFFHLISKAFITPDIIVLKFLWWIYCQVSSIFDGYFFYLISSSVLLYSLNLW